MTAHTTLYDSLCVYKIKTITVFLVHKLCSSDTDLNGVALQTSFSFSKNCEAAISLDIANVQMPATFPDSFCKC